MDRNGTILNDLIYSYLFTPFTAAYWVSRNFRAIWTRKWGYLPSLSSFTLSVAQASESSASQGSKKFSTICQALGTCRTYEKFDETQSSRFDRFAQLIIRKSSKHLQTVIKPSSSHHKAIRAINIIGDAGLRFQIFQLGHFTQVPQLPLQAVVTFLERSTNQGKSPGRHWQTNNSPAKCLWNIWNLWSKATMSV